MQEVNPELEALLRRISNDIIRATYLAKDSPMAARDTLDKMRTMAGYTFWAVTGDPIDE